MNVVVELLLWPVVLFLQAVVGMLGQAKTPRIALYQRIARWALLGSVLASIMAIPLSLITRPIMGIKPLLALGAVLLFVFIVFGNLCDSNVGDNDNGEPRGRR